MPLNDPYLMSMEFTVDAVNKNLKEQVDKYPNKFYAMADIDISNNIEDSKKNLVKAIEEYKLNGLKIQSKQNYIIVIVDTTILNGEDG